MPKLKNWTTQSILNNPYLSPEQPLFRLYGNVYNHNRFRDGMVIYTTQVIGKKGENIITSSKTEYELLDTAEEYERLYPNAKERLLNSLVEIELK